MSVPWFRQVRIGDDGDTENRWKFLVDVDDAGEYVEVREIDDGGGGGDELWLHPDQIAPLIAALQAANAAIRAQEGRQA